MSRGITLGLCCWLGSMLWQIAPKHLHAPLAADTALPSIPVPMRPVPRSNMIANTHLFGTAQPSAAPMAQAAADDAQVEGIIFDSTGNDSLAMLSSNGNTQAYTVGQSLPDGAVVKQIEEDAVIIARDGELRRLLLDIKLADTNARFATLGGYGGPVTSMAGADPGDGQVLIDTMPKPPASSGGIMPVASVGISKATPGIPLSSILAQRAQRFSNYDTRPSVPQAKPKGPH